jgi:hypothetical protein
MVKKNAVKKCKTCKEPAEVGGHLCVPVSRKDHTCDWCGSLIMDARHMCDTKLKKVSYICNTCGRLAVSAEHLCKPKKIS